MKYDLIVIGAGPAGISASLYARSRGLNVLIIEKNKVGGIIGNVSTVTHYSAINEMETGATFSARLEQQAREAGISIVFETVTHVELNEEEKEITTDKNLYTAKAVILANGSTPRKLNIPGEEQLAGHGIGLNAARDGAKYANKHVYVVGGADGAIKEAIYLARFAKKVTIIHWEDQLGCIQEFKDKLKNLSNIDYRLHSRLTAVMGEEHVEQLELTDEHTKEKEVINDDGCGIFVYAGLIPNSDLYPELHTIDGFIPVSEKMETAIPGVFAVGDIRVKQVRQVATAVADGAIAGVNVVSYCK